MFNVLKPTYIAIGDWFAVRWEIIGQASSMEEARRIYGGRPILEAVKP
ncbi:hypothetical protein J7E70_07925 [Variovorax paradoxus]|nr:hypothetical protein [Variovorax paradoxus]MBT2300391.1 hypothetical protein [Variovorax paradoxus]